MVDLEEEEAARGLRRSDSTPRGSGGGEEVVSRSYDGLGISCEGVGAEEEGVRL